MLTKTVVLIVSLVWSSLATTLSEPPQPTIIPEARESAPVIVPDLVGTATWYDAERGNQTTWYTRDGIAFYGAAGPSLRERVPNYYRMEPVAIAIHSLVTDKWVVVYIVDWCSCNGTSKRGDEPLIDLAPAVWRELGVPLGRGVMPIEIYLP